LNLLLGTPAAPFVSVPEQLVERVPRFFGPLVCASAPAPVAQREVEVLAEVGPFFSVTGSARRIGTPRCGRGKRN
jgi:hypothetical protein